MTFLFVRSSCRVVDAAGSLNICVVINLSLLNRACLFRMEERIAERVL